eukprot:TRINITY_DN34035_c0_g1_i1.p1 TRINITY_DN34035_c0_g1~~TRINITY_DN34035_c0_g1_i1.p1  ORF type:complete len:571 (-),score=89.27 TRINITY_DN34035_c0_g1_i1:509-2221(-)
MAALDRSQGPSLLDRQPVRAESSYDVGGQIVGVRARPSAVGLGSRVLLLLLWLRAGKRLTASQLTWAHWLVQAAGLGGSLAAALAAAWGTSGVHGQGALRNLLGLPAREFRIAGSVEPGWEAVRQAFVRNFELGLETASQCCVYHKGVRVVDLHGALLRRASPACVGTGPWEQQPYNADTIQLVFSCSKVLESLAVAIAADKGYLDYDTPITRYWPEFAAGSQHEEKRNITVADLMRHEAGLVSFRRPVTRDDLEQAASGQSSLSRLIEESDVSFPSGTRRSYHGVTRGLIVNELLRRADPKGRTVGRYIQEEIAGPLGVAESCHLGTLPASEDHKVEPIIPVLDAFTYAQLACVSASIALQLGKPSAACPYDLGKTQLRRIGSQFNPYSEQNRMMQSCTLDVMKSWNEIWLRRVESPSHNVFGTSRALGRIAGCLAAGGEIDGRRIIGPRGLATATSGITLADDAGCNMPMQNTAAGFVDFSSKHWHATAKAAGRHVHSMDGFQGWGGFGGSCMVFNQQEQLGIAYNMAGWLSPLWSSYGMGDPRCLRLVEAIRTCAGSGGQPVPASRL